MALTKLAYARSVILMKYCMTISISVTLKFQTEAGPIGGPGLHACRIMVGEDGIDVALAPIPHRPAAENLALGPASSGDAVGTDLAQNV